MLRTNAHSSTLDRTDTVLLEGEPLRALTTLSYSNNVDLQRSAALAFAEITERRMQRVVVVVFLCGDVILHGVVMLNVVTMILVLTRYAYNFLCIMNTRDV